MMLFRFEVYYFFVECNLKIFVVYLSIYKAPSGRSLLLLLIFFIVVKYTEHKIYHLNYF